MNFRKLLVVSLCLTASSAFGVKTQFFEDTESADFKAGTTENVVISNLGRITLGHEVTRLLESQKGLSTVFDVLVLSDGRLLVGGGPEGQILIGQDGEWETFYKADQPYVFSLASDGDKGFYLGTGGSVGKIVYFRDGDEEGKVVFEDPEVQYIWRMARLSDGRLLAATGPNGKLFLIAGKESREIFSCRQKNLQSLAVGPDGSIYVGTDSEGLIYKIELIDGEYIGRAVYDANEEEISALAIDERGNLYASTASGTTAPQQARAYLTKPEGTPAAGTEVATTAPAPATSTAPGTLPDDAPAADAQPRQTLPTPIVVMQSGSQTPLQPSRPAVSSEGNAIYKIDEYGFVTEVFRDQVDIHSMIHENGQLYIGTGPDGYVFAVNPSTEEVSLFAKTETGFVNSIRLADDGGLILGTGNAGQVVKLGPELARAGSFTSQVFDAEQIARWGTVQVSGTETTETSAVTVQTRTSVIGNPEDPGWSPWTEPKTVDGSVHIVSPAGRYIQYRLALTSEGIDSPVVHETKVSYMQNNRRPQVTSITVNTGNRSNPGVSGSSEGTTGGASASPRPPTAKMYRFAWKATDPNDDQLRYDIQLRRVGTPYWIPLETNHSQLLLQWDPQTVPDGEYQIKVIASDELANPTGMGLTGARISDAFIVDNTAPIVEELTCTFVGQDQLLVQAILVDDVSAIESAWISINGSKDWQYVPCADELYDSKTERIDTIIEVPAETDPIMIMIRVEDQAGNTGYGWQLVSRSAD